MDTEVNHNFNNSRNDSKFYNGNNVINYTSDEKINNSNNLFYN
jgi:hypothetical protein